MTLDQGMIGIPLRVDRIDGPVEIVQRLLEMGCLEGDTIYIRGMAPLGDPLEVEIGSSRLSIRKKDAKHILVLPLPG